MLSNEQELVGGVKMFAQSLSMFPNSMSFGAMNDVESVWTSCQSSLDDESMQRGARAMCAISRFLQRTEIAMRVEFANKASRGARGCFSEDFNFEFQHKPSWRRKDKIRSCRQVHHAPHVWGML